MEAIYYVVSQCFLASKMHLCWRQIEMLHFFLHVIPR